MSDLQFLYDWEDPQGARGPELRATWARLEIRVDGHPLTRVLDTDNKTVRDYVYGPLYPIAEWLASNWWSLRFEAPAPRPFFNSRHNLRFASEGFALPNVEFLSDGRLTTVRWRPWSSEDWKVRFLEAGNSLVKDSEFEAQCSDLIEAVLDRLRVLGLESTFLLEEWQRIVDTTPEEVEFCRAAAALGLDPFSAGARQEEMILAVHDRLSGHHVLEEEFYFAADPARLDQQLRLLESGESKLAASDHSWHLEPLQVAEGCAPWEQGYRLATDLRKQMGLADRPFKSYENLLARLAAGAKAPQVLELASDSLFDALVHEVEPRRVALAIDQRKQHDNARSFALCRAVCEALVNGSEGVAGTRLVTSSQTARQKRNRAFAAEFLAPANLLRQSIPGRVIGVDAVETLAEEFGVSTLVIQHQLENHGLVDDILR